MATCLDVVSDALRLGRVVAVGRDPKAAETELGMKCLQNLYDQWVANGMFGRLTDIYLTRNTVAAEGSRYYVPAGVTLTDATNDYLSEDGDTRQPRDLSLYETLDSSGNRTVKLYDRTGWTDLTALELSDTAPLSGRGAIGLAAALACSGGFVAAFGNQPSPDLQLLSTQFMSGLSYKLGSTRDRSASEYF